MASRFRTVAGLCVADEQPRAGCSGRLEFALPGGLRGGHAAGLQGGRAAGLRGGYSAEARTSAPGGLEKRLRIVRIQGGQLPRLALAPACWTTRVAAAIHCLRPAPEMHVRPSGHGAHGSAQRQGHTYRCCLPLCSHSAS